MNFIKEHKNTVIILAITIVLIVVMIFSSAGKPNAGIVSDTIGVVFKPLQSVGSFISNAVKYGKNADKFETENTLLKQQLIITNQKVADYDKLSEENAKLRAMLELSKSSTQFNLVASNVIASDTENWTSILRIDKGLSSGIKKNDAVITETGLVGYVSDVGRNWADITTLIDSSNSVSVVVDRIEEYCMLQGDVTLIDKSMCAIKYLTTETSVSIGDIVTTSGAGGIYPPDITVGKITDIKPNSNGISWDAVVQPVVDFSQITEVFVILK